MNGIDIVVSGLGLVTPLGSSREKSWVRLLQGETGITPTQNGLEARVIDFSLNGARSRMGDFALLAAGEAIQHSGLDPLQLDEKNIGCAVSQSKPVMSGGLDPNLLMASFFGWSAESVIRKEFGLTGPSGNVVAACATGVASIELGAHWIRSGMCEMVLVGASESSLHPLYRAGFEQMGVLAQGDKPDCARPFDRHRQGFVMGEGAGVLLLESLESAQKRKHKPLAVLKKTVLQQSATDPLRFDPTGSSIARLIGSTVKNLIPDYINAHGTGTRFNDEVESRGIRLAFGKKADPISVSSTKASTGHLLGAAGAAEAVITVLALRDQIVPPTLNLTEPDPACDLDYVPHQSQRKKIETALSLSYGFGGQMGAVLFERV